MRVVKTSDRQLQPAQVADLAQSSGALLVDSPARIFGRNNSVYWGSVSLRNGRESNVEKLLALEATTLFDTRLYMQVNSQDWIELKSWSTNANGKIGAGTIHPVWILQIPAGAHVNLLLRQEGASIIRFPVYLYSAEKFVESERKFHLLVGITLGIFLFIGVYIASLRRHLMDPSVALFAVILLTDLAGTFWVSGVWSEVFPGVPESILSPIGFAAYATFFACGSWHARLYLDTASWSPFSDRLLLFSGRFWLALAPWFAVAFPASARILMVWGGTVAALVVVTVSIMASRKKIQFSEYEAATWLASLIFVASYLLARAFDKPLLWSSSALALVQATVIAVLYGVAMSQHLLRQKVALEKSRKEAILERETVTARMRERSLVYAATNHDLRQPLMGVSVFADLLISAGNSEDRANYAAKLNLAIDEVDDILVSMQHLSAMNEISHTPSMETVRLDEILAPLVEEYRNRSAYKNITIRYVPSRLSIHTHVPYFQRIVRNALSNAIRYVGPRGRILVGCRHGGGLRLMIADTGRGMTLEQANKAFEAFTRVVPDTSKVDGAGLGLFSSKSLATSLGLTVNLTSREGKGTTFSIEIRLPPG
jgi:signal transduction histidine kinase